MGWPDEVEPVLGPDMVCQMFVLILILLLTYLLLSGIDQSAEESDLKLNQTVFFSPFFSRNFVALDFIRRKASWGPPT